MWVLRQRFPKLVYENQYYEYYMIFRRLIKSHKFKILDLDPERHETCALGTGRAGATFLFNSSRRTHLQN